MRYGSVRWLAVATVLSCTNGRSASPESFELCGLKFELAREYAAENLGDRLGDTGGSTIIRVFAASDERVPRRLSEVVKYPKDADVMDESRSIGVYDTLLGNVSSRDGSCAVSVIVVEGRGAELIFPDEEWYVSFVDDRSGS